MKSELQLTPPLEPIRPEMERVEGLLHETLARVEEPLQSMLRPLTDGGKRCRPALVILGGRMFAPFGSPFRILAAAVEMLHTATLIHDDLVDKADLRRGQKTLHTIWPVGATVLAGDYLLARSVSMIAGLEDCRLVKIFAETLCTLCAGEIREMCVTEGKHRSREEYYISVEAKTASLFAAAMEMAGILAGAEEGHVATLGRYGRELGMAFQIVDDVLDFTGDEEKLGKPAGSDLRQGLVTLPTLCYLEKATDDVAVNAVLSGQWDEEHMRAAIEAVCSSGAIEASLAEARAHAMRAQEALAGLPDNASRGMLYSLAEFVVERGY
ncbi:MAG: polyprenyl synthetase family protein [Chloroflexota bacterium]